MGEEEASVKVEGFEVWPELHSRNSVSTEDGSPTALGGRAGVSQRLVEKVASYSKT